MGGQILIVFGYFENDDLNYFDQLQNFLENIGIKIHLFGWKHQEKLFKKFNIRRYDLLDEASRKRCFANADPYGSYLYR